MPRSTGPKPDSAARGPRRAREFIFERVALTRNGIRCHYLIDGKAYSYFSAPVDAPSSLAPEPYYLAAVHVGLAWLIDLATLCLPKQVVIRPLHLDQAALAFWSDTYRRLAMERIYAEQLGVGCLDATWLCAASVRVPPLRPRGNRPTLLAMSGGKESLTALQLFGDVAALELFFLQYPAKSWFHLNRVREKLGTAYRTLKVRAEMNNASRIQKEYDCADYYTFVIGQLLFHALLYGDRYRHLIVGNEYSANFGNAVYQGEPVNHQYDKGLRFAGKANAYVRRVVNANFRYFSPFFGLYEYRIAQLFFGDGRYLPLWTSCNYSSRLANFCCRCPKCAFTYVLALAFCSRSLLERFFPVDLLQDLELYRALMEPDTAKPLDCVGEKKEVWLALYRIWHEGKAAGSPVVAHFVEHIFPRVWPELDGIAEELGREHTGLAQVPKEFRERIRVRLGEPVVLAPEVRTRARMSSEHSHDVQRSAEGPRSAARRG